MPELNDVWPIEPDRLEDLRNRLRSYDGFSDLSILDLPPGISFMPPTFKPPRNVDNDFMWSPLGAVVVSLRVASLLSSTCPNDFDAAPIPEYSDGVLLIVNSTSKPPIERRSDRICLRCGRPNRVSKPSDCIVYEDMIPEAEIFYLDTTLHLMITNELKNRLCAVNPTNIIFEEVEVHNI